jgi:hypothetical protein
MLRPMEHVGVRKTRKKTLCQPFEVALTCFQKQRLKRVMVAFRCAATNIPFILQCIK